MSSKLAISVAHLGGYLSGVVAVDGEIRQYTAGAFLIADVDSTDSPASTVRKFYAAQTDFQFSSVQKLERGLNDLEQQLGSYLIQKPWGLIDHIIPQTLVEARRAFLAFRIMDMISDIAPEARDSNSVHKLVTSASSATSEVTFFCVGIDGGLLVLQFNDDSLFIRASSKQ